MSIKTTLLQIVLSKCNSVVFNIMRFKDHQKSEGINSEASIYF